MSPVPLRLSLLARILAGAIFLGFAVRSVGAQTCPPTSAFTLAITRTTPQGDLNGPNRDRGLDGQVEVFFTQQGTIDSTTWAHRYLLHVYGPDGVLVWQNDVTTGTLQSGESYMGWVTTNMRRPFDPANLLTGAIQPPVGEFDLEVELQLKPRSALSGPWTCFYKSPKARRTLGNPLTAASLPNDKLNMVCTAANHPSVPARSEVDPQTGNLKWAIGITSWPYRGTTHGLTVSYASMGMISPDNPNVPGFAGLSVKNSRWTHNYAMWVTLAIDEQAASWAVLNQSGHATTFKRNDNGTYNSRESFQTLTAGANIDPAPSVTFPCNGAPVSKTVTVPSKFTLTDGAGSTYEFSTLAWQKEECTAIAHYLLTKITDRWGRELNLAWTDVTVGGGTEKRLTQVSSPGGPTLTLEYPLNDGLLRHVRLSTEPTGVKHDLGYNGVLDEGGVSRQKLTSITLRGPAGAATRSRTWNFAYRVDAMADSAAYGGSNSISGDLVIRKTQPDGLVISYAYQGVNLPRVSSADYDGRAVSISWPDLESSTGTRVITRAMTGANQFTMTYPGNVKTRYTYSGSDLITMTELADTPAARTWSYTYDQYQRHNLATVRSPLEPPGVDPLIEHDYAIDTTTGHINGITTYQPMENGTATPRSQVVTLFNALNLPWQITASRDPAATFPGTLGLGYPAYEDQLTTLEYDSGVTLTTGNLTKITRRESATQSWNTLLSYNLATPAGLAGLPEWVENDVGARSLFQYDSMTGLPTRAESPVNVAVGSSSPDYPASVTQTAYEEHGLPVQSTDPLNRVVSLGYQAPGDARYLNVITTFGADGKSRLTQLDPMDRPNVAIDEQGVWARWTWTPEGELKTFTRNANDPIMANRRTTTYYRDDRGDVIAIDPPGGPSGRILFDYRKYTQAGVLETTTEYPNGIYLARLTKITFADGRSEHFGYNDAGEVIWKRKSAGTLIEMLRDKQHRVKSVTYPLAAGGASFTTTTAWDEFGRVRRTADQQGTSYTVYDNLNRPTHHLMPTPQKSLDFFYLPNLTLKRWTTQINVLGLGSYQYRADTKGRLYEVQNLHGQLFRTEFYLNGLLRTRTWANGVSELRQYTGRDWLQSITLLKADGGLLDGFDYSYLDENGVYDGTGHLRREVSLHGNDHRYLYNALYELIGERSVDFGGLYGRVDYTLDANGNRTSRTLNGAPTYYGVDAANKLLWVNEGVNAPPTSGQPNRYTLFSYNQNGAMSYRERRHDPAGPVQSLWWWWDGADKLRKVSDINDQFDPTPFFTAQYDGDGIRVQKSDWRGGPNLVAHDYSYGPQGLLWESNPATTYTPGFSQRTNNVDRFHHQDWLGTSRYLTDDTGNNTAQGLRFDGFGNRIAMFGSDPYHASDSQFAGGWGYQTEWSSSTEPGLGLQYLQQRYYDQATGRFISPDPIGIAGGLNLYAYVDNSPVHWIDPIGASKMLPLRGVKGAEYRTDMTEHGGPDMHIKWGRGGGETLVDKQGRVVITNHDGDMTVPVPRDKKKRNAARKVIDKFRGKLGLPPCEDKDLDGVQVDFQALADATIFDPLTILPASSLLPQAAASPTPVVARPAFMPTPIYIPIVTPLGGLGSLRGLIPFLRGAGRAPARQAPAAPPLPGYGSPVRH